MMNIGLLIIRLIVGLTFAGHGTQKLFGWFGGYGLKGTGGWLESIGLKPGVFMALLAGLGELVGGLLLAAGGWFWIAAALLAITMLVAIFTAHIKNGFWSTSNGIEFPFLLLAVVVGLALIGPGAYVLF